MIAAGIVTTTSVFALQLRTVPLSEQISTSEMIVVGSIESLDRATNTTIEGVSLTSWESDLHIHRVLKGTVTNHVVPIIWNEWHINTNDTHYGIGEHRIWIIQKYHSGTYVIDAINSVMNTNMEGHVIQLMTAPNMRLLEDAR
ncbi:MAG TPA: hypothetical protein PKE26_15470 [Kiritimatiellia bacterium]|nr:hypothetical protein [Saprospiraceae bacterium]HMP00494.1 hypothetical protein [Kiritimatiellia bacterium]